MRMTTTTNLVVVNVGVHVMIAIVTSVCICLRLCSVYACSRIISTFLRKLCLLVAGCFPAYGLLQVCRAPPSATLWHRVIGATWSCRIWHAEAYSRDTL